MLGLGLLGYGFAVCVAVLGGAALQCLRRKSRMRVSQWKSRPSGPRKSCVISAGFARLVALLDQF